MSYFSDFGLSLKEEKIYLACLALGASPASLIAERVGLKRPTTYLMLENLVKQGFLSQSSHNGVQQFSAIDPEDLAEVFLQKQRQMAHKIEFFRESIPELKALESKRTNQTKIRLFTGKEAVEKVYSSLLTIREWVSFFDPSIFDDPALHGSEIEKFFWDIGEKIVESGKPARDIFVESETSLRYQKKFQSPKYQIRLLKHSSLKTDSIFFEEKFFLISYSPSIELLEVQNTSMAELQLAMFEGLWKSLETD